MAREIDRPVQINTTITRHNLQYIDSMISVLEGLDIVLWSVFFLVPTGRGSTIDLISAEEFEQVFGKLFGTSQRVKFDIKSTEAQHYRRFLLQRRTEEKRKGNNPSLPPMLGMRLRTASDVLPAGINDGKGSSFFSSRRSISKRFLPISAGNIRKQSLADLYRHSPLFAGLREREI